jgi:hypothetical protein
MKSKGNRLATREGLKDLLAEEEQRRRAQREADFSSIRDNLQAITGEAAAKKVGEILSLQRELAAVKLEAEAKKEAELSAVHKNLENLLHQVKLVTREAESIKAAIGGELWDRSQQANSQK